MSAVPSIKILESFYASIQDLGRYGFRALGVPVSGAMDKLSAAYANALVGNESNSALIEVIGGNFTFELLRDALLAITGAEVNITVNNMIVSNWTLLYVRKGHVVSIDSPKRGFIIYVAIDGGIDVESIMNSKSTYIRGGFGGFNGRLLKQGDIILSKSVSYERLMHLAGAYKAPREIVEKIPKPDDIIEVKATEGIHEELLGDDINILLNNTYSVEVNSDRMGYRLKGEPLKKASKLDKLISIPTNRGYVQIPPDGQPIVLMSDAQTVGGYAVALVAVQNSVDILAQATPGQKVRFKKISPKEAEESNIEYLKLLEKPRLIFEEEVYY
jgi:antagonist of KipI